MLPKPFHLFTGLLLVANFITCRYVPGLQERDVETYVEDGDGDGYFHAARREVLAPKEVVGPKEFNTNPYDLYSIPADSEVVSAQVENGDDDGVGFDLDPDVYDEDVDPETYGSIYERSIAPLEERDFDDSPTFPGKGNEQDEISPDYISRRDVDDDGLYNLGDVDILIEADHDSGYFSLDNSSENDDGSGSLDDDEDYDTDEDTSALAKRGSKSSSKGSSGSQAKSPSEPKAAPQDESQAKSASQPKSEPDDQSQSQSKISLGGFGSIVKKLPSIAKKVPSVAKKLPKVTNPFSSKNKVKDIDGNDGKGNPVFKSQPKVPGVPKQKKPPPQQGNGDDGGGSPLGGNPAGGSPPSGNGHGSGSDSGSGSGSGNGGKEM